MTTYITDIKKRAESAGFSMAEVSREAGLDQAQVSRWLSGRTIPLISSVEKLKLATERLISSRIEALSGDKNG
jgi:transcriptional regulator with XRE-family HTH domain